MHNVAPRASLYAPASQNEQADALSDALYLPMSHKAQPLAPVVTELYRPAAQAVHKRDVVEPGKFEYEPAKHAVHPLAPAARALYVPTSHCTHPKGDVAPVDGL